MKSKKFNKLRLRGKEKDKVAVRELDNIKAQIRLLNHYITDSIYEGSEDVKWFLKVI